MGKMHELLAVEKDIVGRASATIMETLKTFKEKAAEFFTGYTKTYTPNDANDRDLVPPESKELVDTVPSKLKYTFGVLEAEYDWLLQKESTNQNARADLIVDGKTIGTALPATFLLTLENRLTKVREVILNAPTLPNGPKWVEDPQKGNFVFKLSDAQIQYRTRKTPVPFVLHEATDRHPAQVSKEEKTETVGSYSSMFWDGRVTSAYKSQMLERVDKLLMAVRKAIRKANDVESVDNTIGRTIFSYILG